MSDNSKIEWADATWNPITGCTPVSDGCTNCYAKRMADRFPKTHAGNKVEDVLIGGDPVRATYYPSIGFENVVFHPDRLDQPLRWKRPRRIFVCSMGDLFHEDVPVHIQGRVFDIINVSNRHTFMILTKRPDKMMEFFTKTGPPMVRRHGVGPMENVWLGVTAENQEMADQRIPILLQTPAAKRFVSVEPMLGPVDLKKFLPYEAIDYDAGGNKFAGWEFSRGPGMKDPALDWVICGGETGSWARWSDDPWVKGLRGQCTEAGVPFFFKGWGTRMMKKTDPSYMKIDGREWKEFPA